MSIKTITRKKGWPRWARWTFVVYDTQYATNEPPKWCKKLGRWGIADNALCQSVDDFAAKGSLRRIKPRPAPGGREESA